LELFEITGGLTMAEAAAFSEIGGGDGPEGCKTRHFSKIQKASGIAFSDMIFFDDGMYNCRDVNPLGVLCVCVPDGVTTQAWDKGVQAFAEWRASAAADTDSAPLLSA
jgi:magnesium-dependent phosphatase 1